MRLSELFDEKEKDPVAIAAEDFEVTGLTADSLGGVLDGGSCVTVHLAARSWAR